MKKYSPISRGKRESDFLFQGSRGEREILKKDSPLSRRERDRDFIFLEIERRTRN